MTRNALRYTVLKIEIAFGRAVPSCRSFKRDGYTIRADQERTTPLHNARKLTRVRDRFEMTADC